MGQVRLTAVSSEVEAEMLCGRLRAEEIPCFWKRTDFSAAVASIGGGLGAPGPMEVWVNEEDLPRARELAEDE